MLKKVKRHRKRRANRVHKFETHYRLLTQGTNRENTYVIHYMISQFYVFGRVLYNGIWFSKNAHNTKWKKL